MMNFMERLEEKKEQYSRLSSFDVALQKQNKAPYSLCLSSFAFSLSPPNPKLSSLLKINDFMGQKKPQLLTAPLSLSLDPPKSQPLVLAGKSLPFINLKVVGMKDPSFSLSLFPLTPNPKPEIDVSIVGTEDSSLSLSLSLPSSNPNPKPVVLDVKRARPIAVKVEEKIVKRARTTVRIPRRLPINFPTYFPQIPAEFREKIMELSGTHLKLVLRKTLFATDVNRVNSRLSLPQGKCTIELTNDEIIDANRRNVFKKVVGFEVMVIEPNCGLRKMNLRRWNVVNSYVLVHSWNNVVEDNGLEEGDTLQIWSFRHGSHDRLALALVKLND